MRNFKFLATAIVAVMLACVLAVASFAATPFTDVDDKKNPALSDAVSLLNGLGVAKGTSETTFGTMELVTRQQMAAFVYRLMKEGKSLEGGSNQSPFTDLEDSTYFSYVSWANGMGIIKGTSATTFDPKGGITLQDAYTMIIRALGHEDDTYQYPFTYIDKAEELGLDKNLDSVINYTTKLTRGDVAVILYNTFFAETATVETKQEEKLIGNGTKWVLETKSYNLTLAEMVYDVETGNFEVRATPKYAFNENEASTDYIPLCDDYEVDMLHLVAADDDEPLQDVYCEFASTGLTGAADDYIMRGVKLFYTYEEKNGKKTLDKVYFMTSDHSVLETSTATYSYVTAKNRADYYFSGTTYDTSYPKAEGYLTVGSNMIFFFDAPYSYLKPTFTPDMTEDLRYEEQNKKNVKLIDIKCLDTEKGTYSYYIDESKPVNSADDMVANLTRVFSGGIYKLKFFDIDGDGIYEYCHYMPATYGFMDGDDSKYFSSDMEGNKPVHIAAKGASGLDLSFVPTIYYNDADLSGVEFKEDDMVVAYLNPEANIIDVMAVVEPYKGYISKVSNGLCVVDGQTFTTSGSYKMVEELDDDSKYSDYVNSKFYVKPKFSNSKVFPSLTDSTAIGEAFEFYCIRSGGTHVLWYDHLDDETVSFALDELAIPVSAEVKAETYTKSTFDAEVADTVQYVKVYFDGKVSYVRIDEEDMYPALSDDAYVDGTYNLFDIKGQDGYSAYVDKICKAVKNSDGTITLIPLLHAEDEDGNYIGVNRDSRTLVEDDNREQYGNDLDTATIGHIKKIAGSRYALVDEGGDTLLGDPTDMDGETINYFTLTSSSRIIIKNKLDEDKVEYLEFDATTFKGTVASDLKNIQYILRGDPDSKTKADLILLYAEAEDFEFEVKGIKNGWRIVAGSEVAKDEEGNYRYFYKLLNPYTGLVEEKVAGEKAEEKAADLGEAVANGVIVEIKSSVVDEDGDTLGTIDTSVSTGLVYLTEYDAEESYISFVPVEAIEAAIEDGTICCGEEFKAYVESYTYDDTSILNFDGEEFKLAVDRNDDAIYGAALYYEITDDTVITVLTSDKAGADAVAEGEFKLAGVDAIAKASKDLKCYNNKVLNRKGDYGTEYAKYVKAYVYASENAQNEDELPVAEYIIIVVNGGEELIFTDYDTDFLPATHAE